MHTERDIVHCKNVLVDKLYTGDSVSEWPLTYLYCCWRADINTDTDTYTYLEGQTLHHV